MGANRTKGTDTSSTMDAAQAAADAAARAAAEVSAKAGDAAPRAAADDAGATAATRGDGDDRGADSPGDDDGRSANLRDSPMMAHLLDALEAGTDIGHYGRLTFAMVARHFLDEDELLALLADQPDHNEDDMRAMLRQVENRDYNPPKRERILAWQAQQDFPICPTPDDPASCNVYRELRFPDSVYEHINEFHAQQDDDR